MSSEPGYRETSQQAQTARSKLPMYPMAKVDCTVFDRFTPRMHMHMGRWFWNGRGGLSTSCFKP